MIAIIAAMTEEVEKLTELVDEITDKKLIGPNTFIIAKHNNKEIVITSSGVGKTNAGMTMSNLLTHFNVEKVINIGLAGSISKAVKAGDIVYSKSCSYYDVDATGFGYYHGQIPGEELKFPCSRDDKDKFLSLETNGYKHIMVNVVTGDHFISSDKQVKKFPYFLKHNSDVVDMETAAFGHVCSKYSVPFYAIRAISDSIYDNDQSEEQFNDNLKKYALRCKKTVLKLI